MDQHLNYGKCQFFIFSISAKMASQQNFHAVLSMIESIWQIFKILCPYPRPCPPFQNLKFRLLMSVSRQNVRVRVSLHDFIFYDVRVQKGVRGFVRSCPPNSELEIILVDEVVLRHSSDVNSWPWIWDSAINCELL